MNQYNIAVADALARAFETNITKGTSGKEVLLVKVDSEFKIPDPKFDKAAWNEITEGLKHRHKLEAFYNHKKAGDEVLVCVYGWLSEAPEITDAQIDVAIRDMAVMEKVADEQYESLMSRLTSGT